MSSARCPQAATVQLTSFIASIRLIWSKFQTSIRLLDQRSLRRDRCQVCVFGTDSHLSDDTQQRSHSSPSLVFANRIQHQETMGELASCVGGGGGGNSRGVVRRARKRGECVRRTMHGELFPAVQWCYISQATLNRSATAALQFVLGDDCHERHLCVAPSFTNVY